MEKKIITISREVGKAAGFVKFSFQFFKLSEDRRRFLYLLNTQPASSQVLQGLNTDPLAFITEPEQTDPAIIGQLEKLANDLHSLTQDYQRLNRAYVQYWTDL